MSFKLALLLWAMLLASFTSHGQALLTPRRQAPDGGRVSLASYLPVSSIKVHARIQNRLAVVKVEHLFRNDSGVTLEGIYSFPMPQGATPQELTLFDKGERCPPVVSPQDGARVQHQVLDIEPHSHKRIEIVYSQPLPVNGNIVAFDYPLGGEYKKLKVPIGSIEIEVNIEYETGAVCSPTHPTQMKFVGARRVTGRLKIEGDSDAENFKLLVVSLNSLSAGGGTLDENCAVISQADGNASGPRDNRIVAALPPPGLSAEPGGTAFEGAEVATAAAQPQRALTTGASLSVNPTAEAVNVMAVAPAIAADVAHISARYESKRLRDLPSLDPVDSFARLSTGVTARRVDDLAEQFPFRFWINGARPLSNAYAIDGLNNNDVDGRPAVSVDNFDAADSLEVLATRGPGDVSRTGAASINLGTRGGVNDFQGTLFGYRLDRRFGALSPFERRIGFKEPPLFKNTIYGATLGGPIRRDRLFFFASFQGEIEASLRFVDSTASFLTPSKTGLNQLGRRFPNSSTVEDLIMRGPFAQAIGNPQTARVFLIPVLGAPVEFTQVSRVLPAAGEAYEASARIDLDVTARDTLRTEYWYDSSDSSSTGRAPGRGLCGRH